jgi:hypothetical protein
VNDPGRPVIDYTIKYKGIRLKIYNCPTSGAWRDPETLATRISD